MPKKVRPHDVRVARSNHLRPDPVRSNVYQPGETLTQEEEALLAAFDSIKEQQRAQP